MGTSSSPIKRKETKKETILPWGETLIIIPTYDEIDNVHSMISTLMELNPSLSVLIVDDDSPDGTAQIVEQEQQWQKNLYLIKRKGKRGLAGAYIEGFKWALRREYNYIFEMDCDFSHSPEDIKNLLAAAKTHHLVIGSRYRENIRILNWPFYRLLLSYSASLYIRLALNIPIRDSTSGFKCFTRQALEAINLDSIISQGYAFQLELNYKLFLLGFKIKELPITFSKRKDGRSKMTKEIIIESFILVLKLRWYTITGRLFKEDE